MERKLKIVERFNRFVNKKEGCWEWTGGINSTGRGIFWLNGKSEKAHRVSWMFHEGDIPKGFIVCHRCDNGKCVNPDHLFLGTYSDNMQDMHRKKRGNRPRGVNHWANKISEEVVKEIREFYKVGNYTQYTLAKKFGISQATTNHIINLKAWKHV